MFAAPTWAQAPEAQADVYRVGTGDVLEIAIHPGGEATELKSSIPVAGDGTIDVVRVGRVKVAGLATSEIQERIRRRLIDGGVFTAPHVAINVLQYLSQCINVAGAVKKQGRFCLSGPTRLQDILSQAEGIDEETAGPMILVTREGLDQPLRIARRDLVSGDVVKARAANVAVLAGDNVTIAPKWRFCINGAVGKPGCYTFDEGTDLLQGLALGGGLLLDCAEGAKAADRKNILIQRDGTSIKVDLDAVNAGAAKLPQLADNDTVDVPQTEKHEFCVRGSVEKEDCYNWEEGLNLEGALSKAGGLDVLLSNPKEIYVRRVIGGKQVETKRDLTDPGLEGARYPILAGDQIVVAKAECLVTVRGSVLKPGQIPMTAGMTLSDAIAAGGGVRDANGLPLGKLKAVLLQRGDSTTTHDVTAIMEGRGTDPVLQCGDKVFVKPRAM
jgi:polysaccharide export outer membrane protein